MPASKYVDYTFYKNIYGGSLAEPDFKKYSFRADFDLEDLTLGRVAHVNMADETVKTRVGMAASVLTDFAYELDLSGGDMGRLILSETISKHSISYSEGDTTEELEWRLVSKYLRGVYDANGVELTYRGVGRCCRC